MFSSIFLVLLRHPLFEGAGVGDSHGLIGNRQRPRGLHGYLLYLRDRWDGLSLFHNVYDGHGCLDADSLGSLARLGEFEETHETAQERSSGVPGGCDG